MNSEIRPRKNGAFFQVNRLRIVLATIVLAAVVCVSASRPASSQEAAKPGIAAAPVTPEQAEFFETKVRPVLVANCYGCHSKDAQLAGLRVDSREFLLKGGVGGTSLVPGDADNSLLIRSITHVGTPLRMPKGNAKLKDADIANLVAWVKMGAPWPSAKGVSEAAIANGEALTPAQRKFWSLQPVRLPVAPIIRNAKVAASARSPIDRFLLAQLQSKNLAFNAPTDRRTLLRRASFDLIGLPPTDADVAAFVADKSPDAFAKVVDKLLASPRYGERWARYWLDIARYADTKGYVFNEDRNYPNAYTYRDWVIDAFNRDLPYDQFVIAQLAADKLPIKTDTDRKNLAALGFVTVGRRFLNQEPDIMDDRIDVTMRGFQGLTVACARCHDHKFDPVPTKDYYSLYGVFASARETSPPISPPSISEPFVKHRDAHEATRQERERMIREQVTKLRTRQKAGETLEKPIADALKSFRENELPNTKQLPVLLPAFQMSAQTDVGTLTAQETKLAASYPSAPELAMALEDNATPHAPRVFKRGNRGNLGDAIPRRFLLALSPENKPRDEWTTGGRLELAQKIASKTNPLTARVLVNRVWLHHFGQAIVRTPSDFGKQGERPTHPELLDYLAHTFMHNDGWSLKKLHRRILLTSAYQQSSAMTTQQFDADPENRLVGRMNRRRLDLESLRDSLLWASGKLDTARVGGPSVELWQPTNEETQEFAPRRAIYGRIERQNLPGVFKTFDFASPDSSNAQRFRTTVPQQALFLMNNELAVQQARGLAARTSGGAKDDTARVRALYRLLFNRNPQPDEAEIGLRFVRAQAKPIVSPKADSNTSPPSSVWQYGWGDYNEAAKKLSFTPLTHFVNNEWRPKTELPNGDYGWLFLSREGGHTGINASRSPIRRWVAPINGVVRVDATLNHPSDQGDGVRARIVHSREGVKGEWTAKRVSVPTTLAGITVQKGDTLDFIVDLRANDGYDSFFWSPHISLDATMGGGSKLSWSAAEQFAGPRALVAAASAKTLSPWERYAQALLMSNEFMFVD